MTSDVTTTSAFLNGGTAMTLMTAEMALTKWDALRDNVRKVNSVATTKSKRVPFRVEKFEITVSKQKRNAHD